MRERFGTELRAGEVRQCAGCHTPHNGRTGSTTNFALDSPTNLSGKNVDRDGNGVVDLLEKLCDDRGELCAVARFRLKARATDKGTTKLRWRANSSGVEQFVVLRRGSGDSGFKAIATLTPEVRRFRDLGVAPGETYLYKIQADHTTTAPRWSNQRRVLMP